MRKTTLYAALAVGASLMMAGRAPAQEVLYALSSATSPSLYTVDPTTGSIQSAVSITGEEALFGGLAWDGNDLYSIDGYNDPNSDRTFRIDENSGAGVVVGDTGFNWNFRCVCFHPQTGVLFASTDNKLYTIDTTTGAATHVADISGSTLDQMTAFAIDATGVAYGTDIGGNGLFRIDLTTGAATHLGDLNYPGSYFRDLAFDSAGALWCCGSGTTALYTIDIAAVSVTYQFATAGTWQGLAFSSGCPMPAFYCTAKQNSLGCTPQIYSGGGIPSLTDPNPFLVDALNVLNNKNGVFFYGLNGRHNLPFQGGFLCVFPPIKRTPVQNSGGNPPPGDCSGTYSFDFNAWMQGGSDPNLGLGVQVNGQYWSRDPASPSTTGLTDAIEFSICP